MDAYIPTYTYISYIDMYVYIHISYNDTTYVLQMHCYHTYTYTYTSMGNTYDMYTRFLQSSVCNVATAVPTVAYGTTQSSDAG